jgi:hypothetical protein
MLSFFIRYGGKNIQKHFQTLSLKGNQLQQSLAVESAVA